MGTESLWIDEEWICEDCGKTKPHDQFPPFDILTCRDCYQVYYEERDLEELPSQL